MNIRNITLMLIGLIFGTSGHSQTIRKVISKEFPDNNVFIGAACQFVNLSTPEGEILDKQFSYVTPSNDFKQSRVHPEPGKWNWDYADKWVQHAEKNNQHIRIHGPISPQCSRWAREDHRTKEELMQNLEEYFTALCKRYNDNPTVMWMDVVNETVNRDGTWMKPKPGNNSWENPWEMIGYETDIPTKYKHLSDSVPLYIIKAFEIATQHATNKKLVLNQHAGMEPAMWNKIKDLILYLRERGYRVDGIGWQAHISYMRDAKWETGDVKLKELDELISWAHDNNLEFHITENNIHVPNDPVEIAKTKEHTETYMNILKVLLSHRNQGVVTWNIWNIKDVKHYSNKNAYVIGVWDEQYRKKEIFKELIKVLKSPPKN